MGHHQWQDQYLERYYSRSSGFVDGTTEFHQLCSVHIPQEGRVLEIGAGPQNTTTDYLSRLGELHGVDIDPAVLTNPALHKKSVIKDEAYPYADNCFDVCISNYVVEHILDPYAHLKEIYRVLRPQGVYIFRTPNLFHYVSLVSRFSPHWFHRLVANRLRKLPEDSLDPYPTVYRMNTVGRILSLCRALGFKCELMRLVEKEPRYGFGSRMLFVPFMLYERIVNYSDGLCMFRSNIFCVLRKS